MVCTTEECPNEATCLRHTEIPHGSESIDFKYICNKENEFARYWKNNEVTQA